MPREKFKHFSLHREVNVLGEREEKDLIRADQLKYPSTCEL